jgi:hypothetical protein
MDFVADLLLALAAGGVGGFFGGQLSRKSREGRLFDGLPVIGHSHDWHISGKRGGEVRLRCVVDGCMAVKGQLDG